MRERTRGTMHAASRTGQPVEQVDRAIAHTIPSSQQATIDGWERDAEKGPRVGYGRTRPMRWIKKKLAPYTSEWTTTAPDGTPVKVVHRYVPSFGRTQTKVIRGDEPPDTVKVVHGDVHEQQPDWDAIDRALGHTATSVAA